MFSKLFMNRKAAIALRKLCEHPWEGMSLGSFGDESQGSLCRN